MRRLLFPLVLLMAAAALRAEDQPRPARPDEVALFKAAMLNGRQDTEHWAYTEPEQITLRIRESFRVKLIAKVKEGEAGMDFKAVDPNYPPVLDTLTGDFSGSLLFIPVNGTFRRTRTDWKRVKSYDERRQVKIGPLQLLDF